MNYVSGKGISLRSRNGYTILGLSFVIHTLLLMRLISAINHRDHKGKTQSSHCLIFLIFTA